jgi:tetratricopeptide (TPR) repeat protein
MSSILCLSIASLLCAQIESPDLAEWKRCMAEGGRLYDAGHLSEAAHVLEKAVHYAEHFAALDPRLPSSLHDLGFIYQTQSQYAEATRCYLRAIHLWERIGPSTHSSLMNTIDNLIGTYAENHQYHAAKKLMERRLPEMEQSATHWRDYGAMLNMRGGLAHLEHRYGEAERLFRQSAALWEQHGPDQNRNQAITLTNLSHVFVTTKRYQEAYDLDLRALDLLENLDPTAGSLTALVLNHAAFCAMKLQRAVDAERHYQRALELAQQLFGPRHPTSGEIMLRYSAVLRTLERTGEAKSMAREARAILGGAGKGTVDVLALTPMH